MYFPSYKKVPMSKIIQGELKGFKPEEGREYVHLNLLKKESSFKMKTSRRKNGAKNP